MSVLTNYGLYFSKNGTTIRLPVNPEEFTIESPMENERYNVLDLGEVIKARTPKLKLISWECFFPGSPEPYVLTAGEFKLPEFYINCISEYAEDGKPVRFIANRYMEDGGPIFDTNIQVLIEDFRQTEKAGETGDFYYSIQLAEYRDSVPQVVNLEPPNEPEAPVVAVATPQRETAPDVISVGDTVILNGKYWYSSWGDSPYGTANNKQVQVSRIVQDPSGGQNYSICIDGLGWVDQSQLEKVAT